MAYRAVLYLIIGFLALGSAAVQAAVHDFGVLLSGADEVPAVATDGSGEGFVLFDDDTGELAWLVSFRALTAPIYAVGAGPTAHIHHGPIGGSGPPVIFLDSTNPGTTISGEGKSEGVFAGASILDSVVDADIITALFDGMLYMNFHTSFSAGGEIRGQIVPASVVPSPVPLPAAAWLLISGLLAATRWCRRTNS